MTVGASVGACDNVWSSLSSEEREVYSAAGYHRQFGLGVSAALLVIDMEYNFTGDVDEPIIESIRKYSDSCGSWAWAAIPFIARALKSARENALPVVFTHGVAGIDSPLAARRGNQIVEELRPMPGEYIVEKSAASAFHGTDVAAYLCERGVDTILHTGCTTSGCVRASVVDAAAYGFRNAVIEDCVFDRARLPHEVSLFDMDAKYADVINLEDMDRYVRSVRGSQPTPGNAHR
jgi:nicotinamidase-related amidase